MTTQSEKFQKLITETNNVIKHNGWRSGAYYMVWRDFGLLVADEMIPVEEIQPIAHKIGSAEIKSYVNHARETFDEMGVK